MNFFKNKFKIGSFTAVLLALFLVPVKASAQLGTNAIIDALSFFIRVITYIVNTLVGFFVSMGAWLVNFALDLNGKIVGDANRIVEIGWQISRDVANLGFVLIIVVIAIATILRYQDYGAKKLLPKLIGAALIVNFSLAIGFGIIGFADTFTNFFIGDEGLVGGNLGEVITSAFGPHNFYTSELTGEETQPIEPPDSDFGFGAALINSIAGMVFSTVFMVVTFITLLGLAVMLIIRFIYLSFLLILAPIALLLWVSPGLKNLFDKWWNKFLKWTFFGPAVSFFVYISLLTAEQMSFTDGSATSAGTGFNGAMQDIIIQGSQMLIIAGLMIGGLIAAESMGIHGAKSVMNGAKSAWGGVKKVSSRKSRQWAGATVSKKWGNMDKSLAEKTQEAASKGSILAKTFARPMANLAKTGGEDVIKEHEDALKGKSTDQVRATLNTTKFTGRKIAALNKLVKDGKIDKEDVSKYVTPEMKEKYERFGKGGDFKNLQKAAGMDVDMNIALKEGKEDDLREKAAKYIKGFKKKDMKDMPWDTIFKALGDEKKKGAMNLSHEETEILASNLAKGLASENSSIVSSILPKLSAQGVEEFKKVYEKAINEEKTRVSPTENPDMFKRIEEAEESFRKIIDNYSIGFYGGGASGGSSDNKSEDNKAA